MIHIYKCIIYIYIYIYIYNNNNNMRAGVDKEGILYLSRYQEMMEIKV